MISKMGCTWGVLWRRLWMAGAFLVIASFLCLSLQDASAAQLGDLDQDGEITVLDLVLLINHINAAGTGVAPATGPGVLPLPLRQLADVNNDGYLNESDASIIADAILGIPIPSVPPKASVSIPASGSSEVGVTV